MTDVLVANFVDGSDVEVTYEFYRRRIIVIAFDEVMRAKYQLTFGECTLVSVTYSDGPDDLRDLSNLTEGIKEFGRQSGGARRFEVGFADDSVMEIHCREFSMVPVNAQ